jgi:hypothetical protein
VAASNRPLGVFEPCFSPYLALSIEELTDLPTATASLAAFLLKINLFALCV